jgi:molybdate transport system ATP-binding protein
VTGALINAVIDIDIELHLQERQRNFALHVRFATPAKTVALYGPSGAGKSLTLQAMAGLLKPARGHVRIGKHTLFDAAQGIDVPAPARRMGYLFQHYALFPHQTVRQNIAFGLTSWRTRLSRQDAHEVDALIESFGLQAMAHSKPATLSGGQQQRVALARALACKPHALLLDEPFAALNPMLREKMREELKQVRARFDVPVVMITHDIEDVLVMANTAYLMKDGQAVREVDLDRVQSRELARSQLAPQRPALQHPQAGPLRALLDPANPP